MSWPKTVVRITKHKKPRHQLYQPGFNEGNGCWLEGSWVTLPKDEWEARKAEHVRMYGEIRKMADDQHYRDDPVPRDRMNEAQRQAWEHYAGEFTFSCVGPDGQVAPVCVEMAGAAMTEKAADWLRRSGWRILRFVKDTQGDGAVDQTDGLELPDDLIAADAGATAAEPVDFWANVVRDNRAREMAMFESAVDAIERHDGPLDGLTEFTAMMAFQFLIQMEESIVRTEHAESLGKPDRYETSQELRERYAGMRRRLKEVCEPGAFDVWHGQQRKTHNGCARTNLDNSDGRLFCYVLPEFRDDGTHEPWGPRDVPWNQDEEDEP